MARKRKRRRRNVRDNHPGLGAFLGSLAGVGVGHLLGYSIKSVSDMETNTGWPLAAVGSIAGGALGGRIGAAADRKDRSTTGGAIGGIFGPIGAALGGYVGGTKSDRRSNPSPAAVALAVAGGVAAVGAGYAAYRVTQGKKILPGGSNGQLPPAEALQGIVGNSTLEGQQFMIDDIRQPIWLKTQDAPGAEGFTRVPELRVMVRDQDGEMTIIEPAAVSFEDSSVWTIDADGTVSMFPMAAKAIEFLVSGLSPESARQVYDFALVEIVTNEVDWTDPGARDGAIAKILGRIAPKVDWSQGLRPYTADSLPYQAWAGVQTIGTVANQSHFNKQA